MSAVSLTPQEFELHLKDLRERLIAFIESGEGNAVELLREAEQLLALKDRFPQVYERHADVEGLVADVLARRRQQRVMGVGGERRRAPGCLLGWLLKGKLRG